MSLLLKPTEPSIEEIKVILEANNCPHIDYDQVMFFLEITYEFHSLITANKAKCSAILYRK